VQATIDELKRDQKLEKAKETKQRLVDMERESRRGADWADTERRTLDAGRLDIGSLVELVGLGVIGTLLESPEGKKRVRVRVGEGAVLATVADLVGIQAAHPTAPSRGNQRPSMPKGERNVMDREAATAVDVRGQAADEALESVVAALDRAALAGQPLFRIIHGYGTGRLKAVLREYLAASPYVGRFRAGERAEGGDGVTIVELK
jgi:DNA mismatch repair protein MutS2